MEGGYFSDRELGPRSRTVEDISEPVWRGLVALIEGRIRDGSFGYRFPQECPDGFGCCGCDRRSFFALLEAEIPGVSTPLKPLTLPQSLSVLDIIEFCHSSIAKPTVTEYHEYYRHDHLRFEHDAGRDIFRDDVNRILARNGLAYELDVKGNIVRLAPEPLRSTLNSAAFLTGDNELDKLLESARTKYLSPDFSARREALDKLWDAWERLKTIEKPGESKSISATALLKRAAPGDEIYAALDREARELTSIGNNFMIRHSETSQVPIETSEHVDYLFHRMFALITLLLRSTDRLG